MRIAAGAFATVVTAVALAACPPVLAQYAKQDAGMRSLAVPATAANIAVAVSDCIAGDGDAQALAAAGYTRAQDMAGGGQMLAYRRNGHGPLLILPAVRNELRCWVISSPTEGRGAVVDAIGAKLGSPNRGGTSSPGWQVRDYSLTFDWFDEPGKPRLTRVEVYKFPQESK